MNNETEQQSLWRSKTFYVLSALCVALTLFAVWVVVLRVPPLDISPKTTRITGPLTPDGQIDFLKALEERVYPPEMKTDDNGFRLLVRTFGDFGTMNTNEFYRTQKYEKLGLDPNVLPTMVFPREPFEVIKKHYKSEEKEFSAETEIRLRKALWTPEDITILEDWLKENEIPLNTIAEAIRKPVFAIPLLQSPESFQSGKPQDLLNLLLTDAQSCLGVAKMFSVRATDRVNRGNNDGAIDDKITLLRLGRFIPDKGCLVEYLVGIRIENTGMACPITDSKCQLMAKQIRRLWDAIDQLPLRTPLNVAMETERYCGLSAVQSIAHGATEYDLIGPMFRLFRTRCNWNVVYQKMNETYDAMQEKPPRATLARLTSPATLGSRRTVWQLVTPNGRGILTSQTCSSLLVPSPVDAIDNSLHRAESADNIQRLILAIMLYEAEHGRLPDENWAKQIEPYLGKEPEKYFKCPACSIPDGETTYALVLPEPGESKKVFLVELGNPVPLDKAIISVADARNGIGLGRLHSDGLLIGLRDGSVRFVDTQKEPDELSKFFDE